MRELALPCKPVEMVDFPARLVAPKVRVPGINVRLIDIARGPRSRIKESDDLLTSAFGRGEVVCSGL